MTIKQKEIKKTKTTSKKKSDFEKLEPANSNIFMRRPVADIWNKRDDNSKAEEEVSSARQDFSVIFGAIHFVIGVAILAYIFSQTMTFGL